MKIDFFYGKVAIITGSSSGIGKAIAKLLYNNGANIVINGRNPEKLEQVKTGIENGGRRILAVLADVTVIEDSKRLIDESVRFYGKIDILINNAGVAGKGTIEKSKPDVYENILKTNLLGKIYPTQFAIPYIKKTKGSIVFSGSLAGLIGLPEHSAYSGSKMALTAFTQALRIELAGTGVHVGLNYIGFTENDKNKIFIDENGSQQILPKRKQFKVQKVDKVAKKIIWNINKRKKKDVFSMMGKALNIFQKIAPLLLEKMMIRKYLKTK